MISGVDIEEKIHQCGQQLAQWRARHQELFAALRECEQQIIARQAVIEVLKELHAETTPLPQPIRVGEGGE
jgi:hypothetical protein